MATAHVPPSSADLDHSLECKIQALLGTLQATKSRLATCDLLIAHYGCPPLTSDAATQTAREDLGSTPVLPLELPEKGPELLDRLDRLTSEFQGLQSQMSSLLVVSLLASAFAAPTQEKKDKRGLLGLGLGHGVGVGVGSYGLGLGHGLGSYGYGLGSYGYGLGHDLGNYGYGLGHGLGVGGYGLGHGLGVGGYSLGHGLGVGGYGLGHGVVISAPAVSLGGHGW